jgi:hypothetical protein
MITAASPAEMAPNLTGFGNVCPPCFFLRPDRLRRTVYQFTWESPWDTGPSRSFFVGVGLICGLLPGSASFIRDVR